MAGVEYEIKEFVRDGSSTFGEWFEGLGQAAVLPRKLFQPAILTLL